MPRLLILGGTAEAARLARRLAETNPTLDIVTSLAGRTTAPIGLPGTVRIGGFGGAAGLESYLRAEGVDAVIDATHPFAARISAAAVTACAATGLPLLALVRPPWPRVEGDRWIEAESMAEAARILPSLGRRALLAIGRQELGAFADLNKVWLLVRLRAREALALPDHRVVLGHGPFRVEAEAALLREHAIEVVVTKQSGGTATYAKIAAARALALPVLMIRRPQPPSAVEAVADVEAAAAWVGEVSGGRALSGKFPVTPPASPVPP